MESGSMDVGKTCFPDLYLLSLYAVLANYFNGNRCFFTVRRRRG